MNKMTKNILAAGLQIGMCLAAAADVSLNGEWTLDYFPQPDSGAVRTLPLAVPHKTVKATVPGNCEMDLWRAGKLLEAANGRAGGAYYPYEGHQWLYTRRFEAPKPEPGGRVRLVFDGIDTLADVFLNGERIGEAANMFISHSFDVTDKLKAGKNTVQVLFRSIYIAAQHETVGELGYSMLGGAEGEPFRKAPHMYGWDILPRMLATGLWRDVKLVVEGPVRIDQPSWIVRKISVPGRTASITARCRVQAPFRHIRTARIRFSLVRGGKVRASTEQLLYNYFARGDINLANADFWWPRGMGEPALYDAVTEIFAADGTLLAKTSFPYGVRTVALEYDDIYSAERPGRFVFKVNGEPVFIRGTNWVPMDAFHGRDLEFMPESLAMIADLNCNMVRVWGGGVYEPDCFFDFCDREGIMVWQDLATGCSVFPQGDDYAKATREEILAVAMRLRNRASLALWCGNNENDLAGRWSLWDLYRNPNKDRNSRRTIPDVLYEFDVTRPYLPSSPYVSQDVWDKKAKPAELHMWARKYYRDDYYLKSPCWFSSEIGCHGCPNRASLEKMFSPDKVYPWTDGTFDSWNDEWNYKSSNQIGRAHV